MTTEAVDRLSEKTSKTVKVHKVHTRTPFAAGRAGADRRRRWDRAWCEPVTVSRCRKGVSGCGLRRLAKAGPLAPDPEPIGMQRPSHIPVIPAEAGSHSR